MFLTSVFSANKARFWLGIFMLVVAVLYSCHAGFFMGYSNFYLKVDSLYLLTGLSVFPLYYIYVRLLTCDVGLKWSYLVHFIPAVVLSVVLIFLTFDASFGERQVYYSEVLVRNRWPETQSLIIRSMAFVFFASRFVFGFQVIGYLVAGYLLAKKYDHRIADFYSNLEGKQLIWVKLLTVSFLLTSIASLVVNAIGRGLFMTNDLVLAVPSALFSTLFFIIGLQGNKQDYTIRSLVEDEGEDGVVSSGLDPRHDELKVGVIKMLETEQLYLASELRITELCKVLNTNRTYLSNLINNEFKLSFNDLINLYRVKHAVALIEDNKTSDLSLGDIAIDSGFGSLSSFNRAFKKVKGVTPGQYRNEVKISRGKAGL
ncbi:helix-turn-helix domain-containing protein [Sunxiuqinia dokdonensis]|uniref:helix-turn-helix domain-containing protein n=1 Tax=Sunxiuqinia dokdonensis TaxID=1409788 RepID=UPI00069EF94E|nr:helix-turn-helix domain-containing protein [Sunxiuqinia dokdonensis]